MDPNWGVTRAVDMLKGFGDWFALPESAGFHNLFVIRDLEALALIAGQRDLAAFAVSLIQAQPDSAFTAGVITNIKDLSGLVRRKPTTLEEAAAWFPPYAADLASKLAESKDPHIAPVFADAVALASRSASTPLEREEFASSCAVAGRFDDALAAVAAPDFEPNRRLGPWMVVCVEAFRAGRLDLAEQLISEHFSRPGHFPLSVPAGLLGRVPWGGYPFPDY